MEEDMTVFKDEDFVATGKIDEHEYVDLGLPSGLKWATCNIGATSPEEYGNYYAWGETAPKEEYSCSNYELAHVEYWDGEEEEENEFYVMDKYSGEDQYNEYTMIRKLMELEPMDDAATVNWKGSWRMPSEEDFKELIDKCEWTWGSFNGVKGVKIKGPNGSCIFLPNAGSKEGTNTYEDDGGYWSSSLYDDTFDYNDWNDYSSAIKLYLEEEDTHSYGRDVGLPVRPVLGVRSEEKKDK